MNFYPFHIGDYASATRHLSWDEDMAYRRLMDYYYTTEQPIPLDMRQAYRVVCATTEAQREAVEVVLNEFFFETPDGWKNSRCESELDAFNAKKEKASKSAHMRWDKRQQSERNASAMQPQCDGNANAYENTCERIENVCEGNATNTNTNTNIFIPSGINNKAHNELPKKRATRFDLQALPNEWIEFCKTNRPDLNPQSVFDSFRDYWTSVAGQKATKLDWLATWRNWVRNTKRQQQTRNGLSAAVCASAFSTIYPQQEQSNGRVIDVTPRLG